MRKIFLYGIDDLPEGKNKHLDWVLEYMLGSLKQSVFVRDCVEPIFWERVDLVAKTYAQSLQQENERLRGLIEKMFKTYMHDDEDYSYDKSWQTFKQQNNL